MSKLDKKHCICECGGVNAEAIQKSNTNFPGQSSLNFRFGTHGGLKAKMLKALSLAPALEDYTNRDDDDNSVATLDVWATVLDVIGFYQERIINEGYLRTAIERMSVLELARHVNYVLNPGVSASTYLAFTMNEAKGAPTRSFIPKSTKVQSVPEQDQLPQVFETTEEIEARVEWNGIKLLTKKRIIPEFGDTEIYLKGTDTELKPGDGLLIIGDKRIKDPKKENWDFRKVKEVIPDPAMDHTRVSWDKGLGDEKYGHRTEPAKENVKVCALRQRINLFGYNAPDFRALSGTVKSEFLPKGLIGDYYNGISFNSKVLVRTDENIDYNWGSSSPGSGINNNNYSIRWSGFILSPLSGTISFHTDSDDGVRLWINNQLIIDDWNDHASKRNTGSIWLDVDKLYSIRLDYYEKAGVSNIKLSWSAAGLTEEVIPSDSFFNHEDYNEWPDFNLAGISGLADTIHLDAIYPKITKDSWLVMSADDYDEVYKVTNVVESSRKEFTLTTKTMALTLSGENLKEKYDDKVRETLIYSQSEELQIAEKPYKEPIKNKNKLVLEKLIPDLAEDKIISLSGKRNRIQLTEALVNNTFTVEGDENASRDLLPYDSLIVLSYPEDANSGKNKWFVEDEGGYKGSIEITKKEAELIPSEGEDPIVKEIHVIQSIDLISDPTVITLQQELANYFDPFTVSINANVVGANHGETKIEVLGSGNGSIAFQKFTLKQSPLTYISTSTASGIASSLEIRVNDVLWQEVSSFYGKTGEEKIYITSIDDEGVVSVQFGDGITGARLPTGIENVEATYRIGIGTDGLLNDGQLSMLRTPQLGISEVTNPTPSSGAADRETLDNARKNTPLTALTLDRIVSAKDFEDFTRAFTGIGQARVDMIWNGEEQVVFLTIASENEGPVDKESELYEQLSSAIKTYGPLKSTTYIENYEELYFSINAGISVDENYEFETVKDEVVQSLTDNFSFSARDFGQDVTPSEVVAVIQEIEGVVYTDLESLNGEDPHAQHFRLSASIAHIKDDNLLPAELLCINTDEITITEILK